MNSTAMRNLAALAAAGAAAACVATAPLEESEVAELVVEATIADLQTAIARGRTSCESVARAYIDRIKAYDVPRGVNAITVINPRALDRAREIDARLARGEAMGPLFCAPMLVKDNFDTADLPTTGGSIALKDDLPPDDAFMVRRLREADAIVLAKTNMAEWAFSPRETISSSYGRTANAYAPDRTPAGSSGGTASGVAASFGVAGMGTDTGNSIRGPSSHLALFGIRSTIGLTSRDGVIPLLFDRDIAGPMTRTVEDGARIFNIVAGYDPADPYTEEGRGRREADYTDFLDRRGLRGARLGVLRALVDTEDADPQVIAVFEQALEDLRAAGAEIVDPFEIENLQAHLDSEDYFCPRFRHDVYVYMRSRGPGAPFLDVASLLETGQYHPSAEGGLRFFSNGPLEPPPDAWDPPCPDYAQHPGRQAYKNDVIAAMDAAGVDAIIYPSWTNPPAPLETAFEDYKGDNSQLVAPDTGLPAVSVPMGYSYGALPAGLQILGRPFSEGLLIKFAYAYEQATRRRRPPDGFEPLGQAFEISMNRR